MQYQAQACRHRSDRLNGNEAKCPIVCTAILTNSWKNGWSAELAARMTESLADLILLAPPADQSKLLADVLSNLGQAFLEKSGAIEPDEANLRH
jgi:hypothetical protein